VCLHTSQYHVLPRLLALSHSVLTFHPALDISFSLGVGELSDLISTDSGVHIIYRVA